MPTDNITVAFWMWSNDNINHGTPFSYATTDSSYGNEFLIYDYNSMTIYVNSGYKSTGIDVADGTWHYVVVQWSTSGGGWLRVIIDGDIWRFYAYPDNLSAKFSYPIQSGGSLVIANEQDSVGDDFGITQAFKGIIDELRIYSRILDPSEIKYADVEPSVNIGGENTIS